MSFLSAPAVFPPGLALGLTSRPNNGPADTGLALAQVQARQTTVNVSIQAQFVQIANQFLPVGQNVGVPAAAAGHGSLVDRLGAIDPKLARNFQALLDFLELHNPQAARMLEEGLQIVLGHLEGGLAGAAATAGQAGSSPGQSVQVRAQSIQIAFEATVTEFHARIGEGIELNAEEIRVSFAVRFQEVLGQADPLILDLNDNGFETSTPAGGHRFDLLGAGRLVQAATAIGGDALLAFDRNGNGLIDDGTELFGDQNGAVDGFAELALFDENGDGRIDFEDAVYADLQAFQDANLNGLSDLGELLSLAELQIAAILLATRDADEDSNGNAVVRVGDFERTDGSLGRIGDVLLNYLA
jgi:hypothetical protein